MSSIAHVIDRYCCFNPGYFDGLENYYRASGGRFCSVTISVSRVIRLKRAQTKRVRMIRDMPNVR